MKILAVIIALAASLALAHEQGFRLNVTPSLPLGLYRLTDGLPKRGDIVTFCLTGSAAELAKEREYLQPGCCANGLRPLLKILAGLPGDHVTLSSDGLLCGPPGGSRTQWPLTIRARDSQGRLLKSALTEGNIPPGFALVLTSFSGSFDSRYFGYVPLDALQRVEPVYTFNQGDES